MITLSDGIKPENKMPEELTQVLLYFEEYSSPFTVGMVYKTRFSYHDDENNIQPFGRPPTLWFPLPNPL